MTNSEALSCWVKALQNDNLGLPIINVSEGGERMEVDLYNDDPTHLVDDTWSEAVVTPRGQDDKS